MKDQDYIRKAIELADGWGVENHHKHTDEEIIVYSEYGYWCFIDTAQIVLLDALAAQLVRQVDAMPKESGIDIFPQMSIVYDAAGNETLVHSGDDRTMNTIKAIVDSRVLK